MPQQDSNSHAPGLDSEKSGNLQTELQSLKQKILQGDKFDTSDQALSKLSNIYLNNGKPGELLTFITAISKENRPSNTDLYTALALSSMGSNELAIPHFRAHLEQYPKDYCAHSSLINTLHYAANIAESEITSECRLWQQRHAPPTIVRDAEHSRDAGRLRVGYLSPDFRSHAIALFFYPILKGHNRSNIEIFAYSNVSKADATTAKIKAVAEHWRDVTSLDDDAVCRQIRDDRIDILVDLTGHMGDYRIKVLCQKPAPIQLAWLGYPQAMLSTIDFRITDAQLDPIDSEASEAVLRLEGSSLAFNPDTFLPPVSPLPASERSWITFGSFNNTAKLNSLTLRLWSQVLQAIPEAKLLLKAQAFSDTYCKKHFFDTFSKNGIHHSRLKLIPWTPSKSHHLELYSEIDIALDPTPYNGFTTTCEAIIMGVPVLTLRGSRPLARISSSINHALGLDQWIAGDEDTYVEKARLFAADLPSLARLRNNLRGTLVKSQFGNPSAFAMKLEDTYQKIAQP